MKNFYIDYNKHANMWEVIEVEHQIQYIITRCATFAEAEDFLRCEMTGG